MVVSLGLDGDRVESGRRSLVMAEPGSGRGLIEDLHDLRAEAARELPAAAERVLARDPALLVRGSSERQVGFAEQPVMGDHAVAGGEYVRQIGLHTAVDCNRVL